MGVPQVTTGFKTIGHDLMTWMMTGLGNLHNVDIELFGIRCIRYINPVYRCILYMYMSADCFIQ